MRTILVLLFLSFAATCFADDPLETLNTVEDTLTTMEHTLQAQGAEHHDGSDAVPSAAMQDDAPQQPVSSAPNQ